MNVLALFAHPDDETMLMGGTLAVLAEQGVNVHYLCATRGEGGELGEPPVCTREELGKIREQELICAVEALGGASLDFLGYLDPLVGPEEALFAFDADLDFLVEQISTSLRQLEPVAVITHGAQGEYGHPAHVLLHQAARLAVEALGEHAPALYSGQANYPDHPKPRLANKDAPAHLILDVTPVMKRKELAALCHRSQHTLFIRHASEEAGRPLSVPEVLMNMESLHRVLPLVEGALTDPVAEILQQAGVVVAESHEDELEQ